MSIDAPPREETTPPWLPIAVIVGLAGLALAVTMLAGAYGLPRNDDWSYSDLLWRWHDTGDLRLGGWESMTLVGQLVLAWPLAALFHRHVGSLQLFTMGMGIIGATAAFAALREFVSPARALLATALTMMSPLWAPLSLSFMTDVPAFAVQSVCIWLGARSLTAGDRTRFRWFAGSVVVGLFGVTIREYAVVAPVAVLIVFSLSAWGRRERTSFTVSLIVGATSAVVLAVFIAWRRSWAASLSLQPSVPASVGDGASSFARSALFTVVTLAFLVLPAFAFVPMRRLVRTMTAARWALVAVVSAGIILVIGTITTWEWSPPLLGPYLDQRGALGNDILPGNRALLVPGLFLRVVLVVTLGAAILLVALLVIEAADVVRRAATWRERCASFDAATLAWFVVVLTVLSLTAAGAADLPIFDRYVLPAVPFAAGLVLAWKPNDIPLTARTSQNAARWAAVALFLFAGILWAADSGRFDAARWAAGERAVALGYPADRVDAGFEWRNVHRLAGESPMSPSQRDLDACVRLASPDADLGAGAEPLFTVDYWHGLSGEETLTAWRVDAPDCPPVP